MQRILLGFVSMLVVCFAFCSYLHAKNAIKIKFEGTCTDLQNFTQKQKEVIFYAYYYGREYNFGYLMAAIAWKESCAGEYLLNFSDPSAGLYHAYIPGVIKKYTNYKDSQFLRNVVGQMLISNPIFASSIALDSLRYWDKTHKGDLQKIIKSYNKGFAWQKSKDTNKLAQAYYLDISKKIEELEVFIPANIASHKLKAPKRNYHPKLDSLE